MTAGLADMTPKAVAIGMFDGVHLGHRHLLRQVREEATRRGISPGVVTFSVHPSVLLTPDSPVRRLTTDSERCQLLRTEGIENPIVMDFDDSLRRLTAQEFMTLLHDSYGVRCIIMGFNHSFGSDRSDDFSHYLRAGRAARVEVVRATECPALKVSSSIIRKLLASGDVEGAARGLGYRYFLSGTVAEGRRVGRTIGFPTANLRPDDPCKIIPKGGAYTARAYLDGHNDPFQAMVNIGCRPTLDNGSDVTIEAHLLDLDRNLYGAPLRLEFVSRLRDERRFGSLEELKAQLAADEDETRRVLRNI